MKWEDAALVEPFAIGSHCTGRGRVDADDTVFIIKEITGGHGCTVAFDSACFPVSLAMCLQPGILCNAGRMVPMGFSTKFENISQAMINMRELDIIGSRMSQHAFEPTIKHMENGD